MGVPAFFRWLSRKYPSIVVHCIEEKEKIVDGVKIPNDTSQPNPNNVEFDNLYLDMNGIIHPCCHPENKPAPKDEDEMMVLIFEYIDRLFNILRPRRLLYMAIDGVAPRAKMNQQRSRRFRASKETAEKIDAIAEIRAKLRDEGAELPPEKSKEEHFDSNCITPGTPFMHRLAKCLHYYIHDRLNSDPGWKNIQVILSDANVPGEGEHKIMDFIRRQRASPNHDPNTRHCLCGADADLIMLGLATHEPNFTIIREEFKPNQPRPCEICGQLGHEMKECRGAAKQKQGEFDELEKPMASETEFIFIRLNVLREYLEKELLMTGLPFPYDFERCVDDWVFMCFFVGNDFLPHLPSLEIREGAIDRLVRLYKSTVYKTGGYLTDSGLVNLSRVQLILTGLGEAEDEIFKRRQQNELAFREREKAKKRRLASSDKPAWVPAGQFAPQPISNTPAPVHGVRQEGREMRRQGMNNQEAADALRSMLKRDGDSEASPQQNNKRKNEEEEEEEEPHDEVRLWEDGWKERYYSAKFEVSEENYEFRHKVAAAYTLGLCWVLRYYYQGCASWKWFFPYHYAPFASDFINIGDVNTDFEKGTKPFNPMEQLMGVFPAASRNHVPFAMAELMIDPESPIIDFYPDDFKVDLNGKKFAWQGVALLPFVDEKRLLNTLKDAYRSLSAEERKRNTRGDDVLFVGKSNAGYNYLLTLYESGNHDQEVDLNPDYFYGVSGKVLLSEDAVGPNETVHSPVAGLEDIPGNRVVCVRYRDPKFDDDFLFPAKRLKGAKEPARVLKPGDLSHQDNRNWRPQIGMAPARQRAYLDNSGFRKLDRSISAGNPYRQVAPPSGGYSSWSSGSRNPSDSDNWRHNRSRSGPYNSYSGGGGGGGSGYQPRPSFNPSQREPWSRQEEYQSRDQGGYGQRPQNTRYDGPTGYQSNPQRGGASSFQNPWGESPGVGGVPPYSRSYGSQPPRNDQGRGLGYQQQGYGHQSQGQNPDHGFWK